MISKGLLACLQYGFVSVAITLFNKNVLSGYNFPYYFSLTIAQQIFALVCLFTLKHYKIVDYPAYSTETAKRIWPLAVAFFLMVVTGLQSMTYLNVPLWSALRRGTTLVVMITDFGINNKVPPLQEMLSVIAMVAGAFISALDSFQFNAMGYFLTFLNCLTTALYLSLISRHKDMDLMSQMLYCNLLSLPLVCISLFFSDEVESIRNDFMYKYDLGFLFSFFCSATLAFWLNWSIFYSTSVNSPLATSVTGQLKNILTTLFAFLFFNDNSYEWLNIIGLTISTLSSIWYAKVQYDATILRQQSALKAAKDKGENA